MSNIEFFDLLGQIDDKFYEEVLGGDSEKPLGVSTAKKRFSIKRLVLPIAACLVLAVGAGVTVNYIKNNSGIASLESIGAAEAAVCEELYLDEYPDLKHFGDSLGLRSRIMDINCDGANEVVVITKSGSAPPQIYSKTENGMEKTGALEQAQYGRGLNNLDDLFYYKEDGQKYWYYSYKYGVETSVIAHAVARINFDGEKYFTDFPLAYGLFDHNADSASAELRYVKNWDYSLSSQLPPSFGESTEPISEDEFNALWEKYANMPKIKRYSTFEEEYPPFDINNITTIENSHDGYEVDKADNATLAVIKDYGDRKLCLLGKKIFRIAGSKESDGIWASSLAVGLVKDNQLISSDSCQAFSAVRSGFASFNLDPEALDSYVTLYELADTDIAVFKYFYSDYIGIECNFIGVSGDQVTTLMGYTGDSDNNVHFDGGIGYYVNVSDDLTVLSNSIIDNESSSEYRFYPEAFGGDPTKAPHFVKRHTVTAKIARSSNYSISGSKPAEREDYNRWKSVIGSGNIARLEVLDNPMMSIENGPALSAEGASAIVDILYNAELKPYNNEKPELPEGENPPTGGGYSNSAIITAFDENDNLLFDVSFDGTWFNVQYEDGGLIYYFNGENTNLRHLNYYIPDERYASAEILSSKHIDGNTIKMLVEPYDSYAQIYIEHNGIIYRDRAVWLSPLSELDLSVIDNYIVPFKTKDVTGFAVYESFTEGAPENRYARIYMINDVTHSVTALMYENDSAVTSSGSVLYLGDNPEISNDDNSVITDRGDKLTIDPGRKIIRITAP